MARRLEQTQPRIAQIMSLLFPFAGDAGEGARRWCIGIREAMRAARRVEWE